MSTIAQVDMKTVDWVNTPDDEIFSMLGTPDQEQVKLMAVTAGVSNFQIVRQLKQLVIQYSGGASLSREERLRLEAGLPVEGFIVE